MLFRRRPGPIAFSAIGFRPPKTYSTEGAFDDPVADTVMGYILAFARKLPWMDRDMHAGQWNKHSGVSLRESTLGVIGLGNVGKAVVRRAVAFGVRVLGNDIADILPDFIAETGLEVVSLEKLLRQADFVSLSCILNPTSFHLISDRELKWMKPTAYLINTARGPLVDEPALVRALETGQIAGAALDVFEQEPLPEESPLRENENVLLAPHNANSSPQAWERVHHNTIKNLLDELHRHERPKS